MPDSALEYTPVARIPEIRNVQRDFFHSGVTRSVKFRREALKKLLEAIKFFESDLLSALRSDLNKSPFEAYSNEIGLVYAEIRHADRRLRRWAAPRRVMPEIHHLPGRARVIPEPYGTVLIMAPWNYPMQLLFSPLAGAIAAGNTAVLKPSELAAGTAEVCRRIVERAFEPQYVSVVQGGPEVSAALVDADFDYLFFTGSVPVGRKIMEAASRHLTPLTLELGGKSPAFVDASAHVKNAAWKIAFGKFNNAGQTCVAPDYVLVDRRVEDEFLGHLEKAVRAFYAGDALGSPVYGRIINGRHFSRLASIMDRTGAPVTFGGARNPAERFIEPTVYHPVSWDDALMEDELFGPLLPVIPYDELETAIAQVRSRPKPLSLYVFSEDRRLTRRVLGSLSFGGGVVNNTLLHVAGSRLPFGGVGTSGMGRYHGKASFDTFSHFKSVLYQPGGIDLGLAYPHRGIGMGLLRTFFR